MYTRENYATSKSEIEARQTVAFLREIIAKIRNSA